MSILPFALAGVLFLVPADAAAPGATPTATPPVEAPAAAAPAAPAPAPAEGDGSPVVVIDGKPHSRAEYKEFLFRQFGQAEQMIDAFVADRLIAAKAKKEGIAISDAEAEEWADRMTSEAGGQPGFEEISPEDRAKMRKGYGQIAKQAAVLERLIKRERLTEEGLRREYGVRHGERRRAKHVLIRTPPGAGDEQVAEAKAKIDALRAELAKAPADKLVEEFKALAEKESQDPGTRGDDLPEFARHGMMVEEFAATAFGLEEGDLSEPVKTQFGWHVILVTKVVPPAKELDDETKKELAKELESRPVDRAELGEYLESLREAAKVEVKLE